MNIAAIAGDGTDLAAEFCATDGRRWLVVGEVTAKWHELLPLRETLDRLRGKLEARGHWPGMIWHTKESGRAARFLRDFGFPMMECAIPLFCWGEDGAKAVRDLRKDGRLHVFEKLSPRLARALEGSLTDPAEIALRIALVAGNAAAPLPTIPLERQATSWMKDGKFYDNPAATHAQRAFRAQWDGSFVQPDWLDKAESGETDPVEHMKKVWWFLTGSELEMPK